jgi:hypothetical protein
MDGSEFYKALDLLLKFSSVDIVLVDRWIATIEWSLAKLWIILEQEQVGSQQNLFAALQNQDLL